MLIEVYNKEDIINLIKKEAIKRNIPEPILLGLVKVESNFNPFAVRYEPHYRYVEIVDRLKPATCSRSTEINLQKTSWGLFQLMGANARYLGFSGWLTRLLIPSINIKYGVLWFSMLYKKYGQKHGLLGTIAAYNAGSPRKKEDGTFVNQRYVDKVLEASKKF